MHMQSCFSLIRSIVVFFIINYDDIGLCPGSHNQKQKCLKSWTFTILHPHAITVLILDMLFLFQFILNYTHFFLSFKLNF